MRPFLAPPEPPRLRASGSPPTFTILTPAYQARGTVVDAIESALGQTVPAHQLIVVDDGSTDGTEAVLAPYLDRITYIRQENRGTPGAVNAGIRAATGEFVAMLDADDVYEPERVEALTELAARRPDLDILMTDAYLEVGGQVAGRFTDRTAFATVDQSVAIFERCFVAWPAVRRGRLLAVGGFEESLPIAHDWYCWLRLLHDGAAAGLVQQPLMRYRISGQGSLTDDRPAALRDRVRVLELAAALDLSSAQRRELDRFLPRRRRRALLAEAEEALREHRPDARLLAARVAVASGMRPKARIEAAAAMLAPRSAGRALEWREARGGEARIRRRLPAE